VLDRGRHTIKRMFGRLEDFRRIAGLYDRIALAYTAAVCPAATVRY